MGLLFDVMNFILHPSPSLRALNLHDLSKLHIQVFHLTIYQNVNVIRYDWNSKITFYVTQ